MRRSRWTGRNRSRCIAPIDIGAPSRPSKRASPRCKVDAMRHRSIPPCRSKRSAEQKPKRIAASIGEECDECSGYDMPSQNQKRIANHPSSSIRRVQCVRYDEVGRIFPQQVDSFARVIQRVFRSDSMEGMFASNQWGFPESVVGCFRSGSMVVAVVVVESRSMKRRRRQRRGAGREPIDKTRA